MTAYKCERCGKFRRAEDIAAIDHGDCIVELVDECRWCVSPVDRGQIWPENHS